METCLNCRGEDFVDDGSFLVCSKCGLELPWTNIKDEIAPYEMFEGYEKKFQQFGYDRKIYLKRIFRCLEGKQKIKIKSEILSMMETHFGDIIFSVREFKDFLKLIEHQESYYNIWVYIRIYNGFELNFNHKMKGDIYNIYNILEQEFKERLSTDFKNKKKFFPTHYIMYKILEHLKKTYQLPYDPTEVMNILPIPSRYSKKYNDPYFYKLLSHCNLQFLGYKKI